MQESGQASLEAIGLTLLVTAVVTAAAAFGARPAIGDSVVRQLQRGICVVRAGDCERDRQACVAVSTEKGSHRSAVITFVRIDSGHAVLVEEMTDGKVRLTLMGTGGVGLEAALGATADLDFGKVAFGVGGELRAAALATGKAAGTIVLPSRVAAAQVQRWIADPVALIGDRPRVMPEAEIYGEAGLSATIGVTGVVDPVVQGDVILSSDDSLGVRRNLKTGHRTFYYRRSAGFDAAVGAGPEGMRRIAGFGRRESTVYGVEVDGDGRPVDFSISSVQPLNDGGDLPPELQGQAGALLKGQGERVLATERHLDLTRSDNLEAVKGFMRYVAVKRLAFGAVAPAIERLRGRLDDDATYSARSYAVQSSDWKLGGSFGLGAKLGVNAGDYRQTTRLLAGLDRGPSGNWSASTFCHPT